MNLLNFTLTCEKGIHSILILSCWNFLYKKIFLFHKFVNSCFLELEVGSN